MQIVIDIPKEMYQKIKKTNMFISGRRSGRRFDYILFNAVYTGTPLPEHHGRLIDADAYRTEWMQMRTFDPMKLLDMQHTIIESTKEEE